VFVETVNNNGAIAVESKTVILIPDDNPKLYKLVQGIVLMTSMSKIEHRLFTKSNIQQAYQFLGFTDELVQKIEQQ
jgi:hypothetical protein